MPMCEGIIPERTIAIGSEFVRNDEGELVHEHGEPVKRLITETTPEHPCEAEATMRARSMKQATCNLGGVHWVRDGEDRLYCATCFRPGTVTDSSGQVSAHPAMAIEEE